MKKGSYRNRLKGFFIEPGELTKNRFGEEEFEEKEVEEEDQEDVNIEDLLEDEDISS